MRIDYRTFSLPKAGREFADYEDACFPFDPASPPTYAQNSADNAVFRAVVCDGATDSCFSKYWAELLAEGYGTGAFSENVTAPNIVETQAQWKNYLSAQDLPWYAEEKAELGAFAAICGLTLVNDGHGYRAMAVGDCCLFHTRGNQLIESFPIQSSKDFDNFPYLIGSLSERNQGVFEHKITKEDGCWESGDTFFLMSDAVANWFLRIVEEGDGSDWIDRINRLNNHESFAGLIRAQREQMTAENMPYMKDDDVTIVRIQVSGDRSATNPTPDRATHSEARAAADTTYREKGTSTHELPPVAAAPPSYSVPPNSPTDNAAPGSVRGYEYGTGSMSMAPEAAPYQAPAKAPNQHEVRQKIESLKETASSTSLKRHTGEMAANRQIQVHEEESDPPEPQLIKLPTKDKPTGKPGKPYKPGKNDNTAPVQKDLEDESGFMSAKDEEADLSYAQQIAQMNKRKTLVTANSVKYKKGNNGTIVMAALAAVLAVGAGALLSSRMNPLRPAAPAHSQTSEIAPAANSQTAAPGPANSAGPADRSDTKHPRHPKRHHKAAPVAPAVQTHRAYSTSR